MKLEELISKLSETIPIADISVGYTVEKGEIKKLNDVFVYLGPESVTAMFSWDGKYHDIDFNPRMYPEYAKQVQKAVESIESQRRPYLEWANESS